MERQFQLPAGSLLYDSTSAITIGNSKLTDEIALSFLDSDESNIKSFSKYPVNWRELLAEYQEKKNQQAYEVEMALKKKISKEELQKIISEHQGWLTDTTGIRACLDNYDLVGRKLPGANLRGASITNSDLQRVNFRGAKLNEADLSGSNLSGADLNGVNLQNANLSGSNISDADLTEANLFGTDLSGTTYNENTNFKGVKISASTTLGSNLKIFIEQQNKVIFNNESKFSGTQINENTLLGDELKGLIEKGGSQTSLIEEPQENNDQSDIKSVQHASRNEAPTCFNVASYATVFVEHLQTIKDDEEQMLGIFGKWGSGKTYFVKQLKKQLNNERHFVTFSAWKYQTTPAVWAHLYETIFEAYTSNNVFIRSCRKLCYAIYKRWIQLLFIVATCILFFLFAPSDWEKPALIVGIILLLLVFYSSYGNQIEKLWSQIKHIIKRKSFQPLMGIQLEVERELSSLLKHWIGSAKKGKLILFIDDLDRCSLDRIVELIDSLRVVLENPTIRQRMVVLAAIDEQRLAHAIHDKIGKTFSNKTHCNETISEYIDKLFVSGIKIAPLCIDKRSEYVNKLIDADTSIEEKVAEPAEKERRSITVEPSTKNPSSPTGRAEPLTTVRSINKEEIRTVMLNEVKEFRLKLSPRQIKIFYYRLRLAINLYKIHSDTGNLSTLAQAIRLQTEVNHYGFAANQQQASSTRGKTSEQPDRQQKLNELLDADKALKDVVQMVVCY